MELQHFSHQHSLVLIQDPEQSIANEERALCSLCGKLVDCPSYCCHECKFYLHKNCADLAPEINHLFHPQHRLTLLSKSTYRGGRCICNFCGCVFSEFVYHCAFCDFDMDINCALLQASMTENFPNYLHKHPLIFIQNHTKEIRSDCTGCMKPLSGPIYHCLICDKFCLHKECAGLPLEINHLYHRIHPLTFFPSPPIHPDKCCCYLCKIKWKGFVYYCSLCKIGLTPGDVFAPRTITAASNDHPWMLISRQMSFVCDFCGTDGYYSPYVCFTSTGDLLVHKNCISLPRDIMVTRHHHVISHSYSLQQNQSANWWCRICFDVVDARYGSYYCSTSGCNYIAHVNCATDKENWDGTIILKDKDERSKEALEDSLNLITNVISTGEDLVAIEIKHAYHDHNLILTSSGEIKEDNNCDGCVRPLSTAFYSCDQCKFSLHESCAELPGKKRHPLHKHLLRLVETEWDYSPRCDTCGRFCHGFTYECQEGCYFRIDIQCSLLSDTLKHPSHEHPLYLVHNYQGKCNGCLKEIHSHAYRCTKRCDFTLDIQCVTLPLTARYKYDRHPLTLTYFGDSDPSQHYCDLCEKERDPNHLIYYCAECDNSLHSDCAIGELPFIKLGMKDHNHIHSHPLTFVKNIWNCPRCEECGELCYGQTLKCEEFECNFSVHWHCSEAFRY